MSYQEYLDIQTRVEWLYEFHPDFFNQISISDKQVLQKTFLYDVSDQDYPDSLLLFFEQNISSNLQLQRDALAAFENLMELSQIS